MAGTRKEQAERTRRAIIDATRELIAERGYDGVKVGDIARACGIGMGTLYHYFGGKDEIFTYIERGRFAEMSADVVAQPGLDVGERLRRYVRGWFENVEADDVNVSRCWHIMAVERRLPHAEGRTHLDDDIDAMGTLLRQAVAAGELAADTPVEALTHDLVFSLYGASLNRCISYQGFDVHAWAEQWCDQLLEARLAPFRTEFRPEAPAE